MNTHLKIVCSTFAAAAIAATAYVSYRSFPTADQKAIEIVEDEEAADRRREEEAKQLESEFKVLMERTAERGRIRQEAAALAKGQGVQKDVSKAIELLSGIGDDDDAGMQLAEVYLFDAAELPDRYEKAKGVLEALYRNMRSTLVRKKSAYYLGLIYHNGWGVARNQNDAFYYLIEPARFGLAEAQFLIANIYLNGIGAVQSYAEAYLWAALSAANGYEQAVRTRTAAQKMLSPAELEAARTKAQNWGNGNNSATYQCKDDNFGIPADFKIDFDTWRVESSHAKGALSDLEFYKDAIHIRNGGADYEFKIDRKTGSFTARYTRERTLYGSCSIVEGRDPAGNKPSVAQ